MQSLRQHIEDNFFKLKGSEEYIKREGNFEVWKKYMFFDLSHAIGGHMEPGHALRAVSRLIDARDQLDNVGDLEEWLQLFQATVADQPAAVGRAVPHDDNENQLRSEFAADYKDPGGRILSYLVGCIDCFYRQWSSSSETKSWYAPCTTIVQSSGWGKSRAMREIAMAPNQILVFYFSLMAVNHSGYPKADRDILRYFKGITKVEHGFRVFHACFEWLSEQESFPCKKELYKDHEMKRYHRVLERLKAHPECSETVMKDACSKVQKQHASALKSNGVCFLFVFDEAKSLLKSENEKGESPFVLLRRASSHLPIDGQSFVLFIDTTSRVSGLDPGSKVNKGLENLFPPVSSLPTFDVMVGAAPPLTSVEGFFSPNVWLRQGRPLWAAKKFYESEWVTEILQFAVLKLCGGIVKDSVEGRRLLEKPYMSLVMLGRRVGVDVCPQSPAAQELVASHMSVCLQVSASREYVLCTSLPEPALNEAAAWVLRTDRELLCKQLRQLNSLLRKGIASAGERWELVARILLIDAMDKLQQGQSCSTPVYLKEFLVALLPDFTEFPPNLNHLEAAKVFFNSFHRCFGKPSVTDARKYIKKGVGMICAAMQESFDLYIFFVKPDENGQYDVENDKCIGCLAVQVKNWKEVSGIKVTVAGMCRYKCKVSADEIFPDVMMLLHVGVDGTKEKETMKGNQRESERGSLSKSTVLTQGDVFVVKGLHMISVREDISETVKLLLCQSPDPLSIIREKIKPVMGSAKLTDTDLLRETEASKSILSAVYPQVKADKQEESSMKGMEVDMSPSGKARKKRKK